MIVRPHPIHDNNELSDVFRPFAPSVRLQSTSQAGRSVTARSQCEEDVREWVNTFRHADVLVNLSSTVTIEAALLDIPIVNLDFDPQPGQPNQALVKDVNHKWSHFRPVAESGGVWLVEDYDQLVHAVRTYLERPELHREQRKWIAEFVCGFTDGCCGERLADAILDFARKARQRSHTGVA
jgi:CDP-glycerol glycerophosphotransferase (TagB/SpsB family)